MGRSGRFRFQGAALASNGNGTKHRANGKKRVARNGFPTKEPSKQGRHLVDRDDPSRFAPPGPFAGVERVGVGELVPQPHGGAIRRGGTNKGGSGRPPDAFRQLCRELASRTKTVKSVLAILKNPDHVQFVAALRWATEHGYGKPVQPLEHSGSITLEQILARSHAE